MTVAQSTRQLQLSFGSREFSTVTAHTPITIQASNEWQLIGFTAQLLTGKLQTVGIIFVGASSYQFNGVDSKRMDLSPVSVIRIGGASESFSGQISLVRILTPGAVVIKSSKLFEISSSETLIKIISVHLTPVLNSALTHFPLPAQKAR